MYRYFGLYSERSRSLHSSAAQDNSLLAEPTFAGEMDPPGKRFDISVGLPVPIPVKNIELISSTDASSIRRLLGITFVLNSPFRSLGTLT